MTGRFPFSKLTKYPHMKPEDVAVWERYIDAHPDSFESVDYDVPCGLGVEPQGVHDAAIEAGYQQLTQKKIDVVAYREASIYVIEVGPIADARKLGQIQTYWHLYKADHPEESLVIPMVLCGTVEREMEPIFIAQGIVIATA